MSFARDIMTPEPLAILVDDSARHAAQLLAAREIGSVVVVNHKNRLLGMLTDRDIAVGVVAAGKDPETTLVGDLVSGRPVITVEVDDPVDLVATIMEKDAVRRVPVLENDQVVGIISQADLATHFTEDRVGGLVEEISAAPANTGGGKAGRRKTSNASRGIRPPD